MTLRERTSKRLLLCSALTAATVIAALSYGLYFAQEELARDTMVPLSFLGLGMMIKYGDQAFDADIYSKRRTMLLAVPGGLWMGTLIAVDGGSATIFVGLLLALLLARKYDNAAFKVGFGVAFAIWIVALLSGMGSYDLIGAVAVLVAAFVDEKANDLPGVDGGRSWKAMLFHHRPFLKVAVLVLCIVGVLPSYLYFFAFLAFDFGYALVEVMSQTKEVPALG